MNDPSSEIGIISEVADSPLVPVFIFEDGGLTRVGFDRHRKGQRQVIQEDLSLLKNFVDKHPKMLIQRRYKRGITYYLPIDPKSEPDTYRGAREALKRQLIEGVAEDAIFVTLVSEEEAGELVKAGYSIFYPKEINDLLDRYETERPLKQNGRD